MKIAPAVTETRMHVVAIFRVVRFFPEKAAWHRFFLTPFFSGSSSMRRFRRLGPGGPRGLLP